MVDPLEESLVSELDSLIRAIPLDQVAGALQVDQETAATAVAAALPTILAGLQRNASTTEGAGALADAVAGKDPSVLDNLSLDQIDVADGAKILGHVFGNDTDAVASAIGAQLSGSDVLGTVLGQVLSGGGSGSTGGGWGDVLGQVLGGGRQPETAPIPAPAPDANAGSELARKLLPLLAPIILAWLAQQATNKGGDVSRANGGLLQEILGGLLQGAGQAADNRGTGSVVTDILGQILRSR